MIPKIEGFQNHPENRGIQNLDQNMDPQKKEPQNGDPQKNDSPKCGRPNKSDPKNGDQLKHQTPLPVSNCHPEYYYI